MTGAMTGADAPALRALGQQLATAATQFDRIRTTVRSRLYTVDWTGQDGAQFRREWDGQHAPLLTKVAAELRAASQTLLLEAGQQEAAAGSDGSAHAGALGGRVGADAGGGTGDAEFPWGDLGDIFKKLSVAGVGAPGALIGLMSDYMASTVKGHWRSGKWIDEYQRWHAGKADSLNKYFMTAQDAARRADLLDKLSKRIPFVGAALSSAEQWQDDDGKYSRGEQVARAGAVAATDFAIDAGSAWAVATTAATVGAAAGPVGAVVAGVVAFGVVTALDTKWGDDVKGYAADAASVVWDAGSAAVDVGADVLEAGGDLLGDAAGSLSDAFDDVTPW